MKLPTYGKIRPRLRILPDGFDQAPHWCGLFDGGWSSIGRINRMSLRDAIAFYFRVIRAEQNV